MSLITFQFLNAKLLLCLFLTLFQLHFSFATPKPTGLILRAVPDDSPESPLYRIEKLTTPERIEKLIKITYARANYYSMQILNPNYAGVVPDDIRIRMFRDGLFYAVEFTLGSQEHAVKLLLDTAGGLTWTQCQPCINCFDQHLAIFDPRASASYAMLPCNHPLCHGDNRIYNCVNNKCVYDVKYSGGSNTSGVASMETFQFYVDRYTKRNFNNVIFGCSDDSHNIYFQNTDISGIFGLSLSLDSMTTQFSNQTHARFSYCLVPFLDAMPVPITLWFGDDVPQPPPGVVQTTAFVPRPKFPYFYLQLLDISVGNHRIGFDPYTFYFRENGEGGCCIDSGTVFTVIDPGTPRVNAYEEVMEVFVAYYESRNLRRVTTTGLGFDVCYEYPPGYDDFASITFHFNGANYVVDGKYGHFFGPTNFFCVAIHVGKDVTMLGAWHQQNKRLIYDAYMGALHFSDEECVNE